MAKGKLHSLHGENDFKIDLIAIFVCIVWHLGCLFLYSQLEVFEIQRSSSR